MKGAQSRAKTDNTSPYQTAIDVAEVILKVAQSDSPPIRIRTSEWAENLCELKTKSDPNGTKLVNQVRSYFM